MSTRTDRNSSAILTRSARREVRPCVMERLDAREMFSVYTATSLTLAGYSAVSATGINATGHVVGTGFKSGGSTGFVYKGASSAALAGTISAKAINDSGQIVGSYAVSIPAEPEVRTGGYIRSAAGALTKLTTKLGNGAGEYVGVEPVAVNNAGQVAGTVQTTGANFFGFFWSGGVLKQITTGSKESYATAINSGGTVLGVDYAAYNRALSYKAGVTTDISGFPNNGSDEVTADGINDKGLIVGQSKNKGIGFRYNGVWTYTGKQGNALDVNNQGVAVGNLHLADGSFRAFVFRNGKAVDLNTLVTLPVGVKLTSAVSINDSGWIVANAATAAGAPSKAFLLKLSSTPASIAGKVYNDANRNGSRQSTEVGLSGWQAYIDANNDGIYNPGEQTAFSDSSGNYKLTGLTAGTYRIREVRMTGWTRSQPAGAHPLGFYDVAVAVGAAAVNKDFGNWK
jgi:probable HAF family extracellular repeat protein